jgi:isopropylmalate/homocitrate/citramalate synthase
VSELPAWTKEGDFPLDTRLDSKGRWVTTPLNDLSVPTPVGQMPRDVVLRDDTLRSGANTPGVYASIDKKLRIADAIEQMGVREAEVGYGSLKDDRELVQQLRKRGTKIILGMHARSWLPTWKSDIDGIVDCGGHLVNLIGMQGSTSSRALHPHLKGEAFLARMEETIAYAKSRGLKVAFGTDHPRIEVVPKTVRRAVAAGVDRWVIYDTRGWYLPQTMAMLVTLVRAASKDQIEIIVHAHDDFGLATANTFEGLRAGAMGCDVTFNRTGHRCGNAAFEQVAVGVEYFFGYDTRLDLGKIAEISRMVSELYEVPVPANAPIVGHNMFSYGGLHIPGMLRGDWCLWENIRAESVGSRRHMVYGPSALQGGADSPLEAKVTSLGKTPSERHMDLITASIRDLIKEKKFATDAEVERIISRVMG